MSKVYRLLQIMLTFHACPHLDTLANVLEICLNELHSYRRLTQESLVEVDRDPEACYRFLHITHSLRIIYHCYVWSFGCILERNPEMKYLMKISLNKLGEREKLGKKMKLALISCATIYHLVDSGLID
jgi:hypothetical protein